MMQKKVFFIELTAPDFTSIEDYVYVYTIVRVLGVCGN